MSSSLARCSRLVIRTLIETYAASARVRTNICANFLPFDYVSAVLGVSAHRASAGSFVVVLTGLFGVEGQAPDIAAKDW